MKIETRDGIVKLLYGRREQSAWQRDQPDRLLHSYVQLMTLAALTWNGYPHGRPGRAVVVGLGGGILCRFILRHFPAMSIDVIEPDMRVIKYAREYFDLPDAVRIHATDGRSFFSGRTGVFDVVMLDAFGENYIPPEMMTCEFLREIKKRLRPDGVVIANTWVNPEVNDAENITYLELFQPVWEFRLIPNMEGNRILLYNDAIRDRYCMMNELVRDRSRLAEQTVPGESIFSGLRTDLSQQHIADRLVTRPVSITGRVPVLKDRNIARFLDTVDFD